MQVFDGQTYYEVAGERSAWLRVTETGQLIEFRPATRDTVPWTDFAAATGTRFSSAASPCNRSAAIADRQAPVRTPVGDYDAALLVRYQEPACADAGYIEEAYVPYVGLVRRTETTLLGPVAHELIYARLGGLVTLSQPERGLSLAVEGSVKPGDLTLVRLTLRNTTREPLRFTFPSTQMYNFTIYNEAGTPVYTWSATRLFAAVITELEVNGERSWVEPLETQPLRPGRYTVEAIITTAPVRYRAVTLLEIPEVSIEP
jgi:hypothetical protein